MNQLMSSDEMVNQYLAAEDKDLCVRHLAHMNSCHPRQIMQILRTQGALEQAARETADTQPPMTSKASLVSSQTTKSESEKMIARAAEAIKSVTARQYAADQGIQMIRTYEGWKVPGKPGLTFADDGSFSYPPGNASGGTLSYMKQFEGLSAGDAFLKLVDTYQPAIGEQLKESKRFHPDPDKERLKPLDRLKQAKEMGRFAEPEHKQSRGKKKARDDNEREY